MSGPPGEPDTTARWDQHERLYHEMLTRPAAERDAALALACADLALRREVQSLLDEPESAAEFLNRPAIEVAAQAVSSVTPERIGGFVVDRVIGIGGMGAVYRAHD